MKAVDIRAMDDKELSERLADVEEELFRLRFRKATQQLENPMLLRNLKREAARLKTVRRERERERDKSEGVT